MLFLLVPIFGFQPFSLIGINKVQRAASYYIVFRNTYLNLSILISISLFLLLLIFVKFYFEQYYLLFCLTYLIAGLRYFIQFHNQELVQDSKASVFGRLSLATQILALLLTYFFLSFLEFSWEGRLLALLSADIFLSIIRIVFLSDIISHYNLKWNKAHVKEIVYFGAPLFIALAASWITFESDKIIVNQFFSLELVGMYTVAYIIGASINTINQSVRNVYIPMIRNELSNGSGRVLIYKFQVYYSVFIISLASFISVFFYFYDGYILGEEYSGIWKIICIIVYAYAFYGIYTAYGVIFEFYKLTILKSKVAVLGALMNLLLSFSLLPFIGYLAPAFGTLGSFIIVFIMSYKFATKELDKRNVQ
jgi:O-antigen/teichoic acid export membrane protein